MTRKEELKQRAMNFLADEHAEPSDLVDMLLQVEREVLQKVIASVKTQIDIYDSLVEGCDADEFALYNSMTAELSKFIRWLRTQQQELT